MKVKCDYCENYIETTSESCEHCGAPNSQYKRTANSQPETIEQLKEWYVAHNLPDENVTRFFIGKDYKGARAFGIYQDVNGEFVVYKNKSDGTRAVRYRGDDEAFAVNELYQKLRSEIANQKAANRTGPSDEILKRRNSLAKKMLVATILSYVLVIATIAIFFALRNSGPKDGYYHYQDKYFYYYDNSYYYYNDDTDNWTTYYGEFTEDEDQYYVNDVPEYVDDFKDSAAYEAAYQNYIDRQSYDNDDWDSGSSWDSSDSWDSGSTDWSSDW